ncbi:hypothetical protein LXL04_034112 [Taraxacum kok-saghyz]
MHLNSIDWTAFTCPERHFEWLVMSFGLKNTTSIFQRKMKDIFNKHKDFAIVYIDDILIFKFIRHGLIISKKKMQLFKIYIDFLGVNIGEGKIRLQPHIARKALDFLDKLEDLKSLQKFIGLVNYARSFIKDLGEIVGPLYSKTSITCQRYFNQEDIKLKQIDATMDGEQSFVANQINLVTKPLFLSIIKWAGIVKEVVEGDEHIKGKYNKATNTLSRLLENKFANN